MKSIIGGFAFVLLSLVACSGSESTKVEKKYKYVCTMHPEIGADKPGVCSKCGMDLVERDTTK
ncbi:heavy metal-binding domain-containing protein [Mucilaginibacter calamicampi]|uniref:Heavy metal-binding domain-containing protein n=1 Tax=Mucilaginibacter calamicampi TaxID=1302352 RepID=A0ABW2YUG3_9SPHI